MEPNPGHQETPTALPPRAGGDGAPGRTGAQPLSASTPTTSHFWEAVGILVRRWKFIAAVTFAMAIASVVLALLLPR